MLKGLYTSALGLSALSKEQEVVSNNLANANTLGYKKDRVITSSFNDMLLYRLKDPALAGEYPPRVGYVSTGVKITDIVTDYSTGVEDDAGNPQSLALLDDGYFTVNTPQGERYTRNGDFRIDSEGLLVTDDGYPVQWQNGDIQVSAGFTVSENGDILVDGKKVDTLRIVNLQNPQKEGSSLFKGDNAEDAASSRVAQNFQEESNVNAIEEMTHLITIMRAYEANQKVIQTEDSTLEKAVTEIASV
jgi:flagellar basal-body rod protein FlgG